MKDATGELSMTAVAVVAIAAIGVVFSTLIWPTIRTNIMRSTYCSQAFGCESEAGKGGLRICYYCEKGDASGLDTGDCSEPKSIQCPDNTTEGSN